MGYTKYYFKVYEDGTAMVRVVGLDENGRETSYSEHYSEDESVSDGDGSLCPPSWESAYAWTETTREHASSLLKFELEEEIDFEAEADEEDDAVCEDCDAEFRPSTSFCADDMVLCAACAHAEEHPDEITPTGRSF